MLWWNLLLSSLFWATKNDLWKIAWLPVDDTHWAVKSFTHTTTMWDTVENLWPTFRCRFISLSGFCYVGRGINEKDWERRGASRLRRSRQEDFPSLYCELGYWVRTLKHSSLMQHISQSFVQWTSYDGFQTLFVCSAGKFLQDPTSDLQILSY